MLDNRKTVYSYEELSDNRRMLFTLLSNLPGIAYRCLNDKNWTMEFISEGSYKLTGYYPEELIGNNKVSYNNLICLDYRDIVWNSWQLQLSKREYCEIEYPIHTANGEIKWVWERGCGIFDENGILIALEGFISDITDFRNARAEKDRLIAELEAKNREMESIIYVASHDLRSPLVNIMGFGQRIEKCVEDIAAFYEECDDISELKEKIGLLVNQKIPDALFYIKAAGKKMDMLINGLLRLSRTGRAMMNFEKLDMNKMLDSILEAMRFQLERDNVLIERKELPECRGDYDHLSQVFSNLLDNAVKYRDPIRRPVVRIEGYIDGNMAHYVISDNGKGIAENHYEKIWEIFHRLEPGSEIAGEGLGLTISKRIIERHNGVIWVESVPGTGSTFHIKLPYDRVGTEIYAVTNQEERQEK